MYKNGAFDYKMQMKTKTEKYSNNKNYDMKKEVDYKGLK